MEVSHTKKSTRIIIWIITIVMAAGFIGTYFLIILQNEDQQKAATNTSQDALDTSTTTPKGAVDPTAYTTQDPVTSIQITDLREGTGDVVKPGATLNLHYKGTLAKTGQKFDSSYDLGEPVTLSLRGVIEGWQEGVPGMKVGGKRRLVIPAAQAYGASGNYGIPPNSDLVFEIEVLSIVPDTQTAQ